MDHKQQHNLTCPDCGGSIDCKVYDSITVDTENRSLRDVIVAGRINEVTCPSCDKSILVDQPLLYRDLDFGSLIYWLPTAEGREAEAEEKFLILQDRIGKAAPEGLEMPDMQLVLTRSELVEQALIHEAELDPLIVELIKYQLYKNNPGHLDPQKHLLLLDARTSTTDELCLLIQNAETRIIEGMLQYGYAQYLKLDTIYDAEAAYDGLTAEFPGPHVSARKRLLAEQHAD